MTRWEYLIADNVRRPLLQELGDQGWELVAINGVTFYFKRPK